MTYDDLINNISKNEHLSIYKNEHSSNFFGNFAIYFYYKNKIKMQFLNDRGIIEVSIIVPNIFSVNIIPLGFAVNFVLKTESQNTMYTFSQILDAYTFFMDNIECLDKIIEKNMLKKINNKWNQANQGTVSG